MLEEKAPAWLRIGLRSNRDIVQVISFPKCGRTWLRYMLELYLRRRFLAVEGGLNTGSRLLYPSLIKRTAYRFTHDDNPHLKTPSEIETEKSDFHDIPVIFLVRDPRDVLVSLYFEMKHRAQGGAKIESSVTLSEFIRGDRGALQSLVAYLNVWSNNLKAVKHFELLTYEDMIGDAGEQLSKVLRFGGYEPRPDAVAHAVAKARFEEMRRLENSEAFSQGNRLRRAEAGGEEAFKVRRGKIGGFVEYLSLADQRYVQEFLEANLIGRFRALYLYPAGHEDTSKR